MCPVCTVTVIAGLGISRFLGIDDVISSIWIGAFILSFSFVTIDWINRKLPKIHIPRFQVPFIALVYLLVLLPLKWNGSIGITLNTLWGIDKIILGTAIGSVFFLLGIWVDKKVRKIKGRQLFSFQKVIFPVTILAMVSLITYFVAK